MKPLDSKKSTLARLLKPLWFVFGKCFKHATPFSPPRTILIFDFHLIGDVVLLTPLLRVMREAYPEAHIALVAGPWAREILSGTHWVDEIIPFVAPWVKYGQGWRGWLRSIELAATLRRRKWDLGIEVRGDIRQVLLMAFTGTRRKVGFDFTGGGPILTDVIFDDGILAHLSVHHQRIAEHLGLWPIGRAYQPELRLTEEEKVSANQIDEYIGFHFGASLPLRRLPKDEAINLIRRVATQFDKSLVLFIPPDDSGLAREIFDCLPSIIQSRTNLWSGDLRSMIVKLSRAIMLYCMDSGAAHIASALGVPVAVIYGPALSTYVRPIGDNVTIIEKHNIHCKPCDQKHCHNSLHQCCLLNLFDDITTK